MMARMYISTFIFLILSVPAIQAQQKYQGTLYTKLGGKQTGVITVDLDGPNNELIGIEETDQKKGKGKKSTTTTTIRLNTAIISHIIINDTTWYFRDIKYDYDDKYIMNACVRLIEGSLDCGIFQTGRSKRQDHISVKLPSAEFSKLADIDFDYYKATLGWHIMGFGKCAALRAKMEAHQPGYGWTDNTSREDRLVMWKNWVREFNACQQKN